MMGEHAFSTDQNTWVLGEYIRFCLLLHKWVCCFPFTWLPASVTWMMRLLTPSSEEIVMIQQYLVPRTVISNIGFELAWSESFLHWGYNFWVLPETGISHLPLLTYGAEHCILLRRPLNVFLVPLTGKHWNPILSFFCVVSRVFLPV